MKYVNIVGFVGLLYLATACEKDEVKQKEPVKAETVRDLPADPDGKGEYTFFSFKDGLIANSDSASNKWDIAFKSTTIIVNSGTSGPGQAAAAVGEGIFSELNQLPATIELKQDQADGFAIPKGSGNGWYSYDPTNHKISPIAGKVIFVRTTDGNYAKFEILSYYKGAPDSYDIMTNVGRYYTFRYVYQPDGSKTFE